MNLGIVIYLIGLLLRIDSALLLLPTIVALCYHEDCWWLYLATALGTLALSFLFSRKKPKNRNFYEKEGLVVVSLSWIFLCLIGAIPICLSGDIPNYLDAAFEIVSGFTTTGSSVVPDVEALSHAGLFWRSFQHLLGGMGILVFVLTFLPSIGGREDGSNVYLMRAESPGPVVEKLTPKMQTTALVLYGIYLGLCFTLFVLYLFGGVPAFNAMLLAFGTAGTGGFGIVNDSFTSYTPYVQIVTAVFMLLFSINFNLYFLMFMGRVRDAIKSEELHFFLGLVCFGFVAVTINIYPLYDTLGHAMRDSLFQVASLVSSTGFGSADFNAWPLFSRVLLLLLMFGGACAGSTGGGFKESRILILLKAVWARFYSFFHPNSVKIPRMEGSKLEASVINSTLVYLVVFGLTYLISFLLLSFDKVSYTTAFTSVLACLNNIGPGLDQVGPTSNFTCYSAFSKVVLMFDMLAGRLELYPVLILFFPQTWKRAKN